MMKGPLVTDGFRLSADRRICDAVIVLKWCAGNGAARPSVHTETNGAKGCLRWKTMVRLSTETSADAMRFRPYVLDAPKLAFVHSFQVKFTSLASNGIPSDHSRWGLR